MKRERNLLDTARVMFLLNLCILLFYTVVCLTTTQRVCASFGAYDFLLSIGQLPPRPWQMPLGALGFYTLLCVVSFGKYYLKTEAFWLRLLVCLGEIVLCLGVTVSLRFYYSGIALLVLADLVHYVRNSFYRTGFMAVLVFIFAFVRFDILTPGGIPFSAYLGYYSHTVQGYLSSLESVMVCLNILLFVLYMILLFTSERRENVRIQKLNRQLNEANTQLKEYAVELEHMTAMRERNRLAREIHDTLGHTLTGIIMGADAGLALFDAAPEEARKRVEVIAQSARDGLNDVRRSIKALRVDALEKHSLEEALEGLLENFRLTTGLEVEYAQQAGELRFAADEEDTLYRIVQEGLTNAVRHGHAKRASLALVRQGETLTVTLQDDGEGCAAPEAGFGLRHMQERLGMLGGSLTYGSSRQDSGYGGFMITASMPIREKEGKS